jgi:hypothetical protein
MHVNVARNAGVQIARKRFATGFSRVAQRLLYLLRCASRFTGIDTLQKMPCH